MLQSRRARKVVTDRRRRVLESIGIWVLTSNLEGYRAGTRRTQLGQKRRLDPRVQVPPPRSEWPMRKSTSLPKEQWYI